MLYDELFIDDIRKIAKDIGIKNIAVEKNIKEKNQTFEETGITLERIVNILEEDNEMNLD